MPSGPPPAARVLARVFPGRATSPRLLPFTRRDFFKIDLHLLSRDGVRPLPLDLGSQVSANFRHQDQNFRHRDRFEKQRY